MEAIIQLLAENQIAYQEIIPLQASGGDRVYFKILLDNGKHIIGTASMLEEENRAFFNFQKIFASHKIPVPQIIAVDATQKYYLQSDAGNHTLLEVLLKEGHEPDVFVLYKESLKKLANLQITAGAKINYEDCVAAQSFDAAAALRDLNYCLDYYVVPLAIEHDATALAQEFSIIADEVGAIQPQHFMYRDFQGRNIMVNDNFEITFIDFQGGMRGPLQYDVASLLWQAKAALPLDWKEDLLTYYYNTANALLHGQLDKTIFYHNYHLIVLMRLMQVLGAYGRRGLLENKQHFIDSIPFAIDNLITWIDIAKMQDTYPQVHQLLQEIIRQRDAYKNFKP
jgi:aminoglycoside/choline kinase family phosphotransferase